MPITGYRASDQCKECTRDRTECGNCKYLKVDRRYRDRRTTDEVDNFMGLDQWDQDVQDGPHEPSGGASNTLGSAQVVS